MATTPASAPAQVGGGFLLAPTDAASVFTPEDFTGEHREIARATEAFFTKEVAPHLEAIQHQEPGLAQSILRKSAELGLTAVMIPEAYGGMELDLVSALIVTEQLARDASYAGWHGAHTGIGTLPLVLFGTEEQKRRYLPKLATAEMIAAYCLSEPHAGSDAMNLKTRADLSEDGRHYILNGQKMWITNAGFADVFTVFAKVIDPATGEADKNLSAFIVEKGFGGITLNPEEHKMGIKGSSTCPIILEDVKVPDGNVLGEIGKGHHIAFNILNVGRFKLGASTTGGLKMTLHDAVPYTKQRRQFGQPLCSFGLIRRKIADVMARGFAAESMVYRTAGLLDAAIATLDKGAADHDLQGIRLVEEFSIECSMIKVFASEALAFAAEEGVQMLGGYGYCSEYPVERAYRDSRINRIFEGTNEINRMLTVDMLLKRAMKGQLDLLGPAQAVAAELMGIPDMPEPDDSLLADEKRMVANFKKAVLMTAGGAAQKLGLELAKHQETLMHIADMVIDTYMAESVLLRTLKLAEMRGVNGANGEGSEKVAEQLAMCQLYIHDAADRIHKYAKEAVNNFAEGDEQRAMLMGAKRFAKNTPINTAELRKLVAKKMIAEGKYCY